MCKVSVIVPAYNQGDYISYAIQSVLDQAYQDFDLLVVDDGSTDNSREVVENFGDSRIRYIYQQNRGLSSARNTGIQNTTAPLITFLDSDDLFLPEKLVVLVDVLKKDSKLGFIAGTFIPIDERGHHLKECRALDFSGYPERLLLENPFHVGSVLLRRRWLNRVGLFDESLHAYEDWDMWLRLAKAGCRMDMIEQPVSLYRFHPAQMTREANRLRVASLNVLNKIYDDPDSLPPDWITMRNQAYSYAYLRSAAHAFRVRDPIRAISDLNEAISIYPDLGKGEADFLIDKFCAWAQDPRTESPITYLEYVFDNLPENLERLRRRKRIEIAKTAVQLGFTAYRHCDIKTARSYFGQAFKSNPTWLTNRGVLAIFIRSFFSKFIA